MSKFSKRVVKARNILNIALDDKRYINTRKRLALTIIISFITSILSVVSPIFFSKSIEIIYKKSYSDSIIYFIILYFLSFSLSRILLEQRWIVYQPAENHVLNSVRVSYIRHVLMLPLEFHLDKSIGSQSAIVNQGIAGVQSALSAIFIQLIPLIIQLVGVFIATLSLSSGIIPLVIFITIVSYFVILGIYSELISKKLKLAISSSINAQGYASDALLNAELIKSININHKIVKSYESKLNDNLSDYNVFYKNRAIMGLLQSIVLALGFSTAMLCSFLSVLHHKSDIGSLVLVNTYLIQLFRPIEFLSQSYRELRQSVTSTIKLIDIFSKETERNDGIVRRLDNIDKISVDKVSFSYINKIDIIKEVSLEVNKGEITVIVGESGCGKSTMARLLLNLYTPTQGVININDTRIEQINTEYLREKIMIVPQEPMMFKDTVVFNVSLSESPDIKKVWEVIKAVNLYELFVSMPENIYTNVGERGLKLSAGERQRLSLARAFYRDPEILILDESTSALDSDNRDDILNAIKKHAENCGVLFITHDKVASLIGDRIVYM